VVCGCVWSEQEALPLSIQSDIRCAVAQTAPLNCLHETQGWGVYGRKQKHEAPHSAVSATRRSTSLSPTLPECGRMERQTPSTSTLLTTPTQDSAPRRHRQHPCSSFPSSPPYKKGGVRFWPLMLVRGWNICWMDKHGKGCTGEWIGVGWARRMDESGRSGYDLVRVGAEHGVPMARDGERHDEHLIAGVVWPSSKLH